jgi:hypothetical protein
MVVVSQPLGAQTFIASNGNLMPVTDINSLNQYLDVSSPNYMVNGNSIANNNNTIGLINTDVVSATTSGFLTPVTTGTTSLGPIIPVTATTAMPVTPIVTATPAIPIAPVTPFTPTVTPVAPVTPVTPTVTPIAPVTPVTSAVTPIAPVAPVIPTVTPIAPVTPVTPAVAPVAPVTPTVTPVTPVTIAPVGPVTPSTDTPLIDRDTINQAIRDMGGLDNTYINSITDKTLESMATPNNSVTTVENTTDKEKEKDDKQKKYLMYAGIGIVIIFIAYKMKWIKF